MQLYYKSYQKMWAKLPQEIQDEIFLYLDFETLERYRPLQSQYIKNNTKHDKLYKAAEFGTIENIKWLMSQGQELEISTFVRAVISGD